MTGGGLNVSYRFNLDDKHPTIEGLAPWRSGITPESIGGVYGHNAMGSNPSATPRCEGDKG
jgi:hypothetical protein